MRLRCACRASPHAPRAASDNAEVIITQNKATLSPAELTLLNNYTEAGAAQCAPDAGDDICRFLSLRATTGADTGNGSIATTVWTGGVSLAKFLQAVFEPGELEGWRCLELGAGTGVVGIMAGILGASVVLTDLAAALPYLRLNIATNLSANEQQRVAAAELVG